jgi:hypothetical protein
MRKSRGAHGVLKLARCAALLEASLLAAPRLTLSVNGTRVAEGQVPRTILVTISIGEGLDIGEDVGSPVDFTYKPPFPFTGEIEKVTFELQ